ncbi:hypothetical protein D6777_03410 [Candidatus Woesearchaeota archaeon]|nr:MAG: hypothetical protein D6777_03410 [Candidatus Woesearchaeota archaeon]
MKYTLLFLALLLLMSSCTTNNVTEDFQEIEPNNTIIDKITGEKEFGPITAQDKETYLKIMSMVSCGYSHDEALSEYNWSYSRLVQVGKEIDNQYLSKEIFKHIRTECPDKLDVIEASYKYNES